MSTTDTTIPHFSEVLYNRARQAAQIADLPCIIRGKPRIPASSPLFCEFWYRAGASKQIQLVGPWRKTPGILQFTLFSTEDIGQRFVQQKARILKAWFGERMWLVGTLHFIETEIMGIIPLPCVRDGKRITVVDGGFDFYEEAV